MSRRVTLYATTTFTKRKKTLRPTSLIGSATRRSQTTPLGARRASFLRTPFQGSWSRTTQCPLPRTLTNPRDRYTHKTYFRRAGLIPQKPSCRQASPFFDNANRKWCCDACGKHFRGYYECNRHTQHAGKRARCLACDKEINSREDSLRRHYSKFCKSMDLGKNSGNVRFEDAFVHL